MKQKGTPHKNQPNRQPIKPAKLPTQEVEREDQIEGRNAVLEALKSGQEINKLYVAKGEISGSLKQILG